MDFFNNLQDFFANLTAQEMTFFFLVAGLLFLTGLLLGLLIRGSGLKHYKKQLLISEKERADFEARYLAAAQQQQDLKQEVAALSREKLAAVDELVELKKNQPTGGGEATQDIQELQDRLQLLQSENQRLLAALNKAGTSTTGPGNGSGTSTTDLQDYLSAAEARFQAFETRLAELSAENNRLNQHVNRLHTSGATTDEGGGDRSIGSPYGQPHQPIIGEPVEVNESSEEPLIIRFDGTNSGVRTDQNGGMEVIVDTSTSLVVPVVTPADGTEDDLTLIRNIGLFIEKQLRERGVNTFAQIAAWSHEDIDRITKEIGYLPGRIQQDDWVGQAKAFAHTKAAAGPEKAVSSKDEEASATTTKSKTKKVHLEADNLQVIEGIGPKIESILKSSGIKTLSGLAASSPAGLRSILAAAGKHFRSHNPDNWPTQAALARDGKLEELKALQDEM